MNKLKSTLIFSAGALIGALVARSFLKTKYETEAREEVAYMRERFDKKRKKLKEDIEDMSEETSASVTDEIAEKRVRRQYNKTVEDLGYADKKEEEEIYESSQKSRRTSNDRPYLITTEEFSEEMDHYDKLTIYYYEDDEVLTDETEEPIDDVAALVGDEALDNFGYGSQDPETVYVRNDKLQIDYEVIRLSKSYKETVLGMTDD